MSTPRTYRVVGICQRKGEKPTTYKITVPPHIGHLLGGIEFEPELTDDGLLFRPVAEPEVESVPTWVQRASR